MEKELITKPAKSCAKWQIATLLLGVATLAASILAVCFWKEFNDTNTRLSSQKDIATVKCPDQKASNQANCQTLPAGLTDLDVRGLNQAYSDYSKKQFKNIPNFHLTFLPQLSSAEQYIKLNKKQTHIIVMIDIVFDKGGVKGLFYRPIGGGKWTCAAAAHQFPNDDPLSDEAKKVFADDKFWGV